MPVIPGRELGGGRFLVAAVVALLCLQLTACDRSRVTAVSTGNSAGFGDAKSYSTPRWSPRRQEKKSREPIIRRTDSGTRTRTRRDSAPPALQLRLLDPSNECCQSDAF